MNCKKQTWFLILSGALAGFINGFFGGGGGMVVVPLLISACGFMRKKAHATALCVMLPICVISAIIYALNGDFDFKIVLPVTVGFTGGGALGAFLLSKLNDNWVKTLFCVIVLAAGVKILFF